MVFGRIEVVSAHTGSGGFKNPGTSPGTEEASGRDQAARMSGTVESGIASSFYLGCLGGQRKHRIGDIEDSVQSSRQVPQNSGRRWKREAMTEGHRTDRNSRACLVREANVSGGAFRGQAFAEIDNGSGTS